MPYLAVDDAELNARGITRVEWKPLGDGGGRGGGKGEGGVIPSFTLGQDILEAVKEYFAVRGEIVPPEDMQMCLDMIAAEKRAMEIRRHTFFGVKAPPPPPPPTYSPDQRPEYGTKEFWKWQQANKKHFEAKKAAAEKEKADKAKAKAAAAAAKLVAAAAAKAEKEAEKERKKAEKAAEAAAKKSGKGAKAV